MINPNVSIRRPFELLLATGNEGKVWELEAGLSTADFRVLGLADVDAVTEVAETGLTFAENAALKASGYAEQTGLWSLADDSGLEVSALGGAPGVLSARFAGVGTPYEVKMSELLRIVAETGFADRRARFVCAMAISDPGGRITCTAEGICEGTLADAPRGRGGFGYDPVFVPNGFELTFGELPADVKLRISHRSRALEQIIRYLLDFTGISLDH